MALKSAEEMEKAAEEYFRSCGERYATDCEGNILRDKTGQQIVAAVKPPTASGLALALGFLSRRQMLSCRLTGRRAEIVERAMGRIEEYAEERLLSKDTFSGAKFLLTNNFPDWSDEGERGDAIARLDSILSEVQRGMKNE